jgi:hypothetical protein
MARGERARAKAQLGADRAAWLSGSGSHRQPATPIPIVINLFEGDAIGVNPDAFVVKSAVYFSFGEELPGELDT